MPRDLFETGRSRERPRKRRTSVVFASIVAHTSLVAALIVASILIPGVLPTPHASTYWDAPRYVRIEDVPLPPQPVSRPAASNQPTADSSAAPVVAPDGFASEPEQPVDQAVEMPGLVQGVAGAGLAAGNTLVTPPPPPEPERRPTRMHSGINAPLRIHDVTPIYPALARASGVQGIVIIEATIDARGDVVSAKVLRSVPMLDEAAIAAVRQWKYTPARLNGEPIAVVITVTVNFTLGGR